MHSCRMIERQKEWTSTSILSYLSTHVVALFITCWAVAQFCRCQCPLGSQTFEKIAGVSLRNIRMTPLFKGYPGNPSVTKECLTRCKERDDCKSVLLSYTAPNCMMSTSSSETRRNDISMTNPPSPTSYFEKICLSGLRCQRLWAFERVVGFEISGFDDRTIPGVTTRQRCEELCLRENGFFCRSGEFDYSFQQCRLSSEDRRSQPSSFRPAFGDIDYFENQCIPEGSTGCSYIAKEDYEIERTDWSLTTNTEAECQQKCDSNQAFLCQSFSYTHSTAVCKLSSDDSYNLGTGVLRRKRGSEYFEKSNCLDLKLTCTSDAMHLTLNTREPFNGRIYSQSQPYACQVYGKKQTTTRFSMNVNGNCGVELEGDDHLTSIVVIQYHPLIQQKGDRIIKLYCSYFDETNKTVSKTFKVGPGSEPSVTAVVNATAPTPNIRLRITDGNGTDITGARIGDPLYFRIEIDEDSVFGIFARNLTAKDGRSDRKITLIDQNGCPTDAHIFPGLQRIPGSKSLQSRFLAFKFTGDPVVKFEVTVHFCLEECSPVSCSDGTESWGKRKKRQISPDLPIVPDYPLEAAIVVRGASFQDNGTKDNGAYNSGYHELPLDELVCTSKIVVVVSTLGALFLQLGLLAACATCFLLSRRDTKFRYKDDVASTITASLPPFSSESSSHRRLR